MGGSHQAKMALGYRHLFGYGVPKSCESAVLYYQQVAEEGPAQSLSRCFSHATCVCTVVRELTEQHVQLLIERARLSDESSRTAPPEEEEEVIQYYQHAAEAGDVGAQVTAVTGALCDF